MNISQSITGARIRTAKDGKEYMEIKPGWYWCLNLGRWFKVE